MPKLIALERFYYNGRNVEMDEQFVAEEKDVDLLTHAVKPMAKEAPTRRDRPAAGARDRSDRKRKRRSYKRQDMKAED